jgi:hypothetical protein
MKLRFLATGDVRVPERHADGSHFPVSMGQFRRYVGRDPVTGAPSEPHQCDSDTREALYLAKCCKAGDLVAFDAPTAAFCGVAFVDSKSPKGDPK